jgi:hypothetical protein
LRSSLESGSGGSLHSSSKADGRAVAESQRLAAELSRAQEELHRAKTSAQESAFLRRELSQLASQILAATRNQAIEAEPIPAAMAAEMSGAVAMEIPQTPTDHDEPAAEEEEYAAPADAEPAPAEPAYAERVAQREADWSDAHQEQSAAPEAETEAVEVETAETEYVEEGVETEYAETEYVEEEVETDEVEYTEEPVAEEEDYADQEDEVEEVEEPAPPKRGLAARFAARRARRNAAKAGGGRSLSDRLRGVTSESPETHT